MSVKLEEKYIKNKLRDKFNELEVYNAIDKDICSKLSQMIKDNSEQINLEDNKSDVQINNTIQIMRFMLTNLTNIENEIYWDNINDDDLENILDLADGDFKNVVNSLLDIMLEIGQDIRIQSIRQLDILNSKIKEMAEIFKFNTDIDKKLKEFGLDRDLLTKIQQGDKESIELFQKTLVEKANKENKPKRQYTKKSNKK